MSLAVEETSLIASNQQNAISRLLDATEKCVLLGFFAYFLIPIVEAVWLKMDFGAILLAVSETLVVVLVLVRRPATLFSQKPMDWALAFGATLAPTLVRPTDHLDSTLCNFAMVLMVVGIGFQIYSKYILGRRFGVVAANRGICSRGPYRIVRHPIYFGYLLVHIGFLCISPSWSNIGLYVLTYALMVPRLFAEERLLRKDPEYNRYCEQVRCRLIPGLF